MDLGIGGRGALVCGSSAGLGQAIAERLAAEGCRVAVNGRSGHRVDAAAAELRTATGADVIALAADVSVADDATNLVNRARQRLGALDILVCNAGGPVAAPFAELQPAQWQEAIALNLLSTVNLCRAAVPAMRERGWGRIVCLTSIAAKQGVAGLMLSTTARAGVLGFAKALSDEAAGDGITVNVVCPGYMRTARLTDLMETRAKQAGRPVADVTAELVAGVPAGRIGEPDELAAAVAFLASEPARYITGAVLQIDGGAIRSIF